MEDEAQTLAMGCIGAIAAIALVVIIIVWVGGQVGEAVQDARIALSADQTERAQARVDEAQARADRAAERTDASRERNVHTETMYMLWTTVLAHYAATNPFWSSVSAAALALFLGVAGIAIYEKLKQRQ
jgi:hypothetical protein